MLNCLLHYTPREALHLTFMKYEYRNLQYYNSHSKICKNIHITQK